MAQETYRIDGHVIDRQTKAGVAGLRVEVWDKDLIFDDMVGGDTTDEQGVFHISFEESYFAEIFLDRRPDLYFKIFRDDTLIANTEDSVLWNVKQGEISITIEVDANDQQKSQYNIQGNLVFDHGLPADGVTVRLYSVGFGGKDTLLGEVKADAQGKYSIPYKLAQGALPNVQVRVLDAANTEVTISNTKFNTLPAENLNLVVPAQVQPMASEFQRLAADMEKSIGGIANLGQAQEGAARQDFTLLNKSTNWDARLAALAATAAQQTTSTGLGQDVLYALFRVGLPTDPSLLAMVSSDSVQQVLNKACQAGIVSMDDQQISAATTEFQNFASKARLAITTPGAASSFNDLLTSTLPDAAQQAAFADLYFSNPSAADFWTQAVKLEIPPDTLDALKLQGKFLHLTFNNAPLAQKLQQDIGSLSNLSQIVDKDYHLSDTWQRTLQGLAGSEGNQALQKLIPPAYEGATTAERLAAYSGDLARKIRFSFPTQVVARMIERNDLPLNQNTASNVSAFLRIAAPLGYSLGRTPLNAFLKNSSQSLPAMDAESIASLKIAHRLFQVTPSSESLQAAVKLGFTSAGHIASYAKDEFMNKFASAFPPGEASLVFGQAQTVSAVTFNFLSMAKQLDNSPPIYALSASGDERQNAKNAIIQQFPSMESIFGNTDFCECEDYRSVLSPAAYFVDVMEFLNKSARNLKGYTPLDVLIGINAGMPKDPKQMDPPPNARRPDLGALPLTCENTNTAMPYIDLVNEIFEYYIANKDHLDTNYAYDTGSATTADLTAEPQHTLPLPYDSNLKQALFPLNLPFDLWTETVRGFLNYFHIPLARVLDTLRPVDNLELFPPDPPVVNAQPYYRAQIFAESLGISPSEYAVLTTTNADLQPLADNWFKLFGYTDKDIALYGQPDPTDPTRYQILPLKNAKNLSRLLGVTYQELADLLTTGFLNPGLYSLIFQFKRFGIDMSDAFSYTNQPGYPTFTAQQITDFEAVLKGISDRYKTQNSASTFDAKNWLTTMLPSNYSQTVLVLAAPNSGCDFGSTTLQYADNKTAATPLDFVKLNLFVRLWKKLGWTLDETDRALQLFLPTTLPDLSDANFQKAWATALVYLAHLDDLNTRLAPAMGRTALLPLWSDLPVKGDNSLYAQLFLTHSVLNNDWAFDDPNDLFPVPVSDLVSPRNTFSAHQTTVQGVLGLSSDEIAAIFSDASVVSPGFTKANLAICYRYSMLAKCLQMKVTDMISLKAMSGLNPFQVLSSSPLAVLAEDVPFNQTLLFVKQVQSMQNSGFTVEDMEYLLRHRFDPVGKYQTDQNALMTLVQSVAGGLQLIQAQSIMPRGVEAWNAAVSYSPGQIVTCGGIYYICGATNTNQTPPNSAFWQIYVFSSQRISISESLIDQTLSKLFPALMLEDLFKLLTNTVTQTQNTQTAFNKSVGNILGVWASMSEYEAIQTGVTVGLPAELLTQADSAITLSYDQTDKLQWLGYRGVLTDVKMNNLTAVTIPPALAPLLSALLKNVQQQVLPGYSQLVGGFLAMWANSQTFTATQTVATPASQIDSNAFFAALKQAQQFGTITEPVPTIQFSYEDSSKIQTLSCAGVLSASMQSQLAALMPTSSVLVSLLQDVRNITILQFQTLAADHLTVVADDLDTYSKPFLGLDVSQQRKLIKEELVSMFHPLLTQKLSRQLIVQTLSSSLGSNPSLTEALVSDAALLADPSNPGKSLMGSFLALGQQGVSASYYTSTDGSGTALANGRAAKTDMADPTNSVSGISSSHFEGYLQVPTDGQYRFFAELGNTGAAASFQLYTPDSTALIGNPIIASTSKATKDHDEVSQFVQMKGGVLYHFTLDFTDLGANGASLLLQGETLSKGALSQIVLYPRQAVDAFIGAKTLLAKALQILQVTGLNEREINYLIANSSQFNYLRLSSLPTQRSDDNVVALFSQLLALADYADLRKGPAGGGDGLIDVFLAAAQSAPQETNTPWTILANITRRNSQIVHDVATALGSDQHFVNNIGIRRIWDALQLQQIVGIPATSLTAATAIATLPLLSGSPAPVSSPTPEEIAATNFKNAVKAKYTADNWRPIAQSVFDKLRQKKRDALVAYLVNDLKLENSNQLFEYFLVDPGMEPVVQTSRLRLAMSSLQTFIQRCLLNLENGNIKPEMNVAPSAIDADWWAWMKRYRVWQANREIFLFPENWMVPELRQDKTDLFQTLESALLQGDITADLADDAFSGYLKELDKRARLDIVAMYLDQAANNAGLSTLHVLGRTYGHPHKYFYRTYANETWFSWEAVTQDIEGNHITLAIWRGRLNVFWVTFISQPLAPKSTPTGATETLGSLTFDTLTTAINKGKAIPQMQVQLHWIEHFQGKWTNRISSEINSSALITDINDSFNPDSDIFIHVSKEVDGAGNEGAVRIHLDLANSSIGGFAFRVTTKNCNPDFKKDYWTPAQQSHFGLNKSGATAYTGSKQLNVYLENSVATDGNISLDNLNWTPDSYWSVHLDKEQILQSVNSYALVPCANPVVPPFVDPNALIFCQDAGSLVAPFFYKDTNNPDANSSSPSDELTFFVQPSLTETTIDKWEWAPPPSLPSQKWNDPNVITGINVIAQVPATSLIPVNTGDPDYSLFPMQNTTDWVTSLSTVVPYGGSLIGKGGAITMAAASKAGALNRVLSVPSVMIDGSASGRVTTSVNVGGKQGLSLSQVQTTKTT